MTEYLSPGIYLEDVDSSQRPIWGVDTLTVGFLGQTERGPVDHPRLVTSFYGYLRKFGGYLDESYLTYAVKGFFQNGGVRCFVQRVVSNDQAAAPSRYTVDGLTITAIGPGSWGNGIAVKISNAGIGNPDLFKLTIIYWAPEIVLSSPVVDPTNPANRNDRNLRKPTLIEFYDNLSADPAKRSYYKNRVNGVSNLVKLSGRTMRRPVNTGIPLFFLQGGHNGSVLVAADYIGHSDAATGQKTGLAAFEEIKEIALLCCPDENGFPGVTEALVDQCEKLKDRFAILQAPEMAPPASSHHPPTTSQFAAYYCPWLEIRHPRTGEKLTIPPGGHLAGIYNRTDSQQGVHKAPANQVVHGIERLQFQIPEDQQDILNSQGVNVLRYLPKRGNLVWGARTTSIDPEWRYISVRRLVIFIEKSIAEGTRWIVFEPSGESLWEEVRLTISDFLIRLWRDGMLMGATAEKAFFVKCDRTTMTEDDINKGRLICLVGVAPSRPAEFIIFRLGQWDGKLKVEEN